MDKCLLPALWEQFGEGTFLSQQDYALVHKARSIKARLRETGVEELDWPYRVRTSTPSGCTRMEIATSSDQHHICRRTSQTYVFFLGWVCGGEGRQNELQSEAVKKERSALIGGTAVSRGCSTMLHQSEDRLHICRLCIGKAEGSAEEEEALHLQLSPAAPSHRPAAAQCKYSGSALTLLAVLLLCEGDGRRLRTNNIISLGRGVFHTRTGALGKNIKKILKNRIEKEEKEFDAIEISLWMLKIRTAKPLYWTFIYKNVIEYPWLETIQEETSENEEEKTTGHAMAT
ncbi:uncharacterized protein [Phyllobates terribilis]|uniref:uncharacterized protein n=1 Tax=Phyllobates terribilis TaxID=111132 RepID=UPI003CCAF9F4